jgi:hypothetical protein
VGELVALHAAGFRPGWHSARCPLAGVLGLVFTEVTCHIRERVGRGWGGWHRPGYGAVWLMWP